MKILPIWISCLPVLAAGKLEGNTIFWNSTPGRTNLTSGGQAMDGAFEFQVGVFTGGFVPDASNMTGWSSHWASPPGGATPYLPANNYFSGNFIVNANPVPFTIGAKGYVWGRKTTSSGSEWILFSQADWTWPAPGGIDPQVLNWSTGPANQVILGAVNSSGSQLLMTSAAVLSYDQWRGVQLAGELLNGPNDDPDHDGSPNILEFVFGTLPLQPGAPVATPVSIVDLSGQKFLQVSIPRLRNRLATLTVGVSGNLVNWSSGSLYTAEISNTPTSLVVRDLVPGGPGQPRRFMRFGAAIPP